MHPSAEAAAELSKWSRKMGFILPDGTAPDSSLFVEVTSTSVRRKLFKSITEKIQDRRYVLKVRRCLEAEKNKSGSKHDALNENIVNLQRDISELEIKTDECLKKINIRVNTIQNAETSISDLKTKIILLKSHRNHLREEVETYKETNKRMKCLMEPFEAPDSANCEKLMSCVKSHVEERWRNSTLLEDIKSVFEKTSTDGSTCDILWQILAHDNRNAHHHFNESNVATTSAYEKLNNGRLALGEHGAIKLARVRILCALGAAATVLINGSSLSQEIGKFLGLDAVSDSFTDPNVIEETFSSVSRALSDTGVKKDLRVEEPKALRVDCLEKKRTYENWCQTIRELSSKLKQEQHEVLDLEQSLLNSSAEMNERIRKNETHWRDLVRKHAKLHNEHAKLIVNSPIDSLRKPSINDLSSSETEISTKDIAEEFRQIVRQQTVDPMEDVEVTFSLEHWEDGIEHSKWEESIKEDLTQTAENTAALSSLAKAVRRTLRLYAELPFENMIPNSITVDGLTFQEHKMQLQLNTMPATSNSIFQNDNFL